MKESKTIFEEIKNAKNVAIFAHKNPDPDAFGSMFGAREFCRALGTNAQVFAIQDERYVDKIFPMDEIKTDFRAKDFDLVILTDCQLYKRVAEDFVDEIKKAKNVVVVDHHEMSDEENVKAKILCIYPQFSSASEMWAQIFCDNKIKISPTAATYLYCGIVGDTNRFMHNNLTAHVFEIAKMLFECNANVQFVYDEMYRKENLKQIKLQNVFYDNIKYVGKGAYVSFTLKQMKKLDAGISNIKQFSDKMIEIEGVEASVLAYEVKKNVFKFSLRSKGMNVSAVARRYGGGGHTCASAFELSITERDLKKRLPIVIAEILHE